MSSDARVVAAVRLDDPDHDVALLVLDLDARRLEHRVRLADAGRGAEEDRQLAARGLLSSSRTRASSSSGSGRSWAMAPGCHSTRFSGGTARP